MQQHVRNYEEIPFYTTLCEGFRIKGVFMFGEKLFDPAGLIVPHSIPRYLIADPYDPTVTLVREFTYHVRSF